VFDVSEPNQLRFSGYGQLPIPTGLDEEITTFVRALGAGGPAAVARIAARASEDGRDVLRAYAERMATQAVRARDATLLQAGLVAVVVGGLDRYDREALVIMPVIEDSATIIGVSPAQAFEEASLIVGHPGAAGLASWLGRTPENRSLAAMGYVRGADRDGFRYVRNW
jgi:hypothetical protein